MKSKVDTDDLLFIQGLHTAVIVGIHPQEQQDPQDIRIDIELRVDTRKASENDDIRYAVDYAAVCQKLLEYLPTTRFQLIETLAENLAQMILQEFLVSWVRVTLHKMPADMPDVKQVGITIERAQR